MMPCWQAWHGMAWQAFVYAEDMVYERRSRVATKDSKTSSIKGYVIHPTNKERGEVR